VVDEMSEVSVSALLPAALIVHALAIVGTLATSRRARWCRRLTFGGSALASALTTAAAASVLASGQPLAGVLFAHEASGLVVDYVVTPLSAWFLIVLGAVEIPVVIYSIGYLAHAVRPARTATVGVGFNVLIAAVSVVFIANNVIGFLFAWEIMTLATAALVATEHETRSALRAAYLYLIMSHVGTGALVAAFFTLASLAGSMSFSDILTGAVVSGPFRDVLFALFFFGFGVKAGVIPLHVWLPEAHPAAPSSISALMSAVLIKAGIYGLFRVCAFGLGTPTAAWGLTCMGIGTLSAILGVLYALTQNDLKRMLAYSTIENAGIILLGLGAGMTMLATGRQELAVVAIAASLYHAMNHAAFKGLLFLGAGSVVMATSTRQLGAMGGLLRRMPWTGGFFLVGALAISGVPPLNGFASEWLTFQSLLLGFEFVPGLTRVNFPLAGALLALTSALAAVCFVKAFGIAFLALPRSAAAADAHESPATMLVPLGLLTGLCLTLGVCPGFVLAVLGGVTSSLPGLSSASALSRGALTMAVGSGPFGQVTPAALAVAIVGGLCMAAVLVVVTRVTRAVRRAPTWGCGGTLTPSTEYTATAFSKPLLMVFREVYRPTREVEALADVSPYFPTEVRYRVEIEPTFERHLYDPLVRGVFDVAERMKVLQAGSLHAYLSYVLLLGAALLIWLGGQ
jgi:hydrogenase-4 component B